MLDVSKALTSPYRLEISRQPVVSSDRADLTTFVCRLHVNDDLVHTASDPDLDAALGEIREFLLSVVSELSAVPDQIRSFGT